MITGKSSLVGLRRKGSGKYRKRLCQVASRGKKPLAMLGDRCQGHPHLATCGALDDMAGRQVSTS